MSTELAIRREIADPTDHFGGGVAGAFLLHLAVAAALAGWAFVAHHGQSWGDSNSTNGAIQATMVADIPLPQKQPMDARNVLATDAPSPAPVAPTPHTVEVPRPDAIPIPAKPTPKPVKVADKATPPPPLHPQQPVKPDPTKAPTGEAPGVRIAMSSTQTRLGTFTVGVTDATFGSRFAYYNEQIKRKLESQWFVGMLDRQASGHRVYITFQVARDGSVSRIKLAQPSNDPTLDQTALAAVQHVDTFGPLPDAYQGSYIDVMYYFEAP